MFFKSLLGVCLLPNTEAAEDRVEHLIGGRGAGNLSEVLRGEVEVCCDKLRGNPVLQPPLRMLKGLQGLLQRAGMAQRGDDRVCGEAAAVCKQR